MPAHRRMARSGARDEQGVCVWAKGLFLSGGLREFQDAEDVRRGCYHEGRERTRGFNAGSRVLRRSFAGQAGHSMPDLQSN
jgi:hypothetical protein